MMKKSNSSNLNWIILIVAGFSLIFPNFAFALCPDGITAYWKLDETSGPTYFDAVGNNHGAGNAPPVAAISEGINGAQRFDGLTHGIDVPASSTFNWLANESFSVEFWLKTPADENPATNQVVVGRNQAGPGGIQWWIGISNTGAASFYLSDQLANVTDGEGSGPRISDGQWHHVVLVRDAVANKVFFYVDSAGGSAVANFDGPANPGGFGSLTPVTIGYFDSAFRFDGLIDEVAIYNRALSGPEIADHFAAGQAGKSVTSLRPPPEAVAGDDKNVTVGTEVTLSAVGTTGTDLTYLWTQTAPAAPVVVNNAATPTVTFIAPAVVGDPVIFTFELTVTADDNQFSSDSVNVTVSVAPEAVAGADQNVTVGAEVTLSAAGSTGTNLTYLWTQTAPVAPVVVNNATTPTVTFTAPDVVGDPVNFTFRLTVTDEYGHSAADDVTVNVSAASAPPPAPPASGGGGGGGCFINTMF